MVVQYKHTLTCKLPGTGATLDETGDWTEGTEGMTLSVNCRAESNSAEGYITGTDGQRIDFSWIVYLPSSTPEIKIGTKVSINADGILIEDTAKRFSVGQFNCRLWL